MEDFPDFSEILSFFLSRLDKDRIISVKTGTFIYLVRLILLGEEKWTWQ
ncbi:MAG: hypothetical protein Q8O03_09245 [Nanoarchaeota archaeon]|nr:hypothetical protein [Nanoarchaeota archaeon]